MNKKILIGSIIAVCILIGVSFTSVVGYRSVVSDVKESPLFNIRSSRAVEKDSKKLTSGYVGKGETLNLQLPILNIRYKLLQQSLEIIKGMDDGSLQKILQMVRTYHQIEGNVEINSLINSLKQIDDTSNIFISNILDNYRTENLTIFNRPCSIGVGLAWIPGCIIIPLFLLLLTIIGHLITVNPPGV